MYNPTNHALLTGLALCLLFGSCHSVKYVEVERVSRDTVRQVSQVRDSIYIHDSVNTAQYQRGDTFYVYQTRWRDRWHVQTQTDTLRTVRIDSIPRPYPVEVTKEVSRPRTSLERFLIGTGAGALMLLIIFIIAKIKRYLPPC